MAHESVHTISPKGGTRESAARKRNSKASAKGEEKSFHSERESIILNEKMFKETQTIQREPKYRNNIQEVQANKSVR